MKAANYKQVAPLLLRALIGAQVLVGFVLIVFTDFGRGLSLWGSAALVYLGLAVLEQLSSLRELLTYSVMKQGDFTSTPEDVRDEKASSYPVQPAASARSS